MNKNFGLFLAMVAFIMAFGVVVMMHVPRKGVAQYNIESSSEAVAVLTA